MAADITCPNCKHVWLDYAIFDEDDTHVLEEKLATREQCLGEMREILKGIVDAWDKSDVEPRLLTVTFHKESIQRMRRMVEEGKE